ncbi:MAG TPA: pimeloyl-ACP methyl ester esterase BioH [Casimicrobiaceae bacterium]|nr:pimeloyl-ACP methyl ester esterase BioH [Casimicrobiaceae bacterium]
MNANVARVHVESVGVGPPLVLLHGFAMHGGLFAPVLTQLAATRRVHVADLPGHGYSAPPREYTLDAMVDAIDDAVRDIDQPLDVAGWSLGGLVAQAWALRHPRRFRRIVLIASTPRFVSGSDWPHAMARETLERFGDELRVAYEPTLKRFLTLQVQGSDQGRAILSTLRARLFERGRPTPEALDGTLQLLEAIDLRGEAARIRHPSLVVCGDRDALVPSSAGTWLARALPHGSSAIIEGAAHVPFVSHRDAFLAAVMPFLHAR